MTKADTLDYMYRLMQEIDELYVELDKDPSQAPDIQKQIDKLEAEVEEIAGESGEKNEGCPHW